MAEAIHIWRTDFRERVYPSFKGKRPLQKQFAIARAAPLEEGRGNRLMTKNSETYSPPTLRECSFMARHDAIRVRGDEDCVSCPDCWRADLLGEDCASCRALSGVGRGRVSVLNNNARLVIH